MWLCLIYIHIYLGTRPESWVESGEEERSSVDLTLARLIYDPLMLIRSSYLHLAFTKMLLSLY